MPKNGDLQSSEVGAKSSPPFEPDPTAPARDSEATEECGDRQAFLPFTIVGVGASAGGLDAFTQLLRELPTDSGMAFVLVQHLATSHASALAEILSRATKMPVTEVHGDAQVGPNHVYVMPAGQGMVISRGTLQLVPRPESGLHHPIDQFFRALAEDQGHKAIGVVLSGTATDGTAGLQAIKAEGGITFAQDVTAQHEGMPHSAIASGGVDFVLPPKEIAREIVRIGHHSYTARTGESSQDENETKIAGVVQLLHHATGVDFSNYKTNTLYRRITRRMVLREMEGLKPYLQLLRDTPAEVEALYHDILINVTSFFRDSECYEALKSKIFPKLIEGLSHNEPLRIWTIGCSTGEEAYSLAIALTECFEAQGSRTPIQIFATDLNDAGVEKARAGIYPKGIAQSVSPERLRRFFVEVDGSYSVSKTIRDRCVFSRHNLLVDPPFSRIDLISCRNVLIYMEPVLQRRIVPILHYALKPNGFLWLGSSETIGSYRNLFEAADLKQKIFVKKPGAGPTGKLFPLRSGGVSQTEFAPSSVRDQNAGVELQKEADRVVLAKFSPPGVLISSELEILQYRGDTSPYLAPIPGKASLNLMKMLREGLLVGVRGAIARSGKAGTTVREERLRIKTGRGYLEVDVEVVPIQGGGAKGGGFLILFEPSAASSSVQSGPKKKPRGRKSKTEAGADNRADLQAAEQQISSLTQELVSTREYLQSLIEQQEAANEELESANEEVQSANEELQSINEELETSKEEIQSSNEELATVNDELNSRNAELYRLNNDLGNLLDSVQMPIVLLGPDLCVRRFTPMAEKIMNLVSTDVGRPLVDIKLNFELPDLGPLLIEVFDTVTTKERAVCDRYGYRYSLRVRPYRTQENKIDGVALMLIDVDALKRAQEFTESIVATVSHPLLVLDSDLRVRMASRSYYESFHSTSEETEKRSFVDLGIGEWDIPELRKALQEILPRDNQFNDFEVEREFKHIGKRTLLLSAQRLHQASDQAALILLSIADITERKQMEDALRKADAEFRQLADSMPQIVWAARPDGFVDYYNERWFEFTGFSRDSYGQQSWEPILHPDDLQRCVDTYFGCIKSEKPYQLELRFKDRVTGAYRWFLNRAVPVRNEDGSVRRWFGTSTDIDNAKQTELLIQQNAERFRTLVEQVKDYAIFRVDPQGIVITWNEGVRRLLGFDEAEFVGKDIVSLFFTPEDVRDGIAQREFEQATATGKASNDRWKVRKDGTRFFGSGITTALHDEGGVLVGFAKVIRDQTEQHRLEEELRQSSAKLSDADRCEHAILAMRTHEIRNSLAAVNDAVQGLDRPDLDEQSLQTKETIVRQVTHLTRLVEDLLDVSRIVPGNDPSFDRSRPRDRS